MAELRPATAADAGTIRKLILNEHLDPTSLDWRHFTVAEDAGQIIGTAQVKPLPGVNEFGSLVVLPAYRGRGIAAQLIAALEAQAGLPLYLLCREQMEPYYLRFGFLRLAFWRTPPFLRLKLAAALPLRLGGVRVIAMVKE
jgi:amino-acid N-acetyltransferase